MDNQPDVQKRMLSVTSNIVILSGMIAASILIVVALGLLVLSINDSYRNTDSSTTVTTTMFVTFAAVLSTFAFVGGVMLRRRNQPGPC